MLSTDDFSSSTPLHALIIGIDDYQYAGLRKLHGCVADADEIAKYLNRKLGVRNDHSHVKNLRNSEATRANIVQSIRDFAIDGRIKRGDPILIYYAGHGGEADAPLGWPTGGSSSRIQMLLPYNFSPNTTSDPAKQGIHDMTLGILLKELA